MIEVANAFVDGRDLVIVERVSDGSLRTRREIPDYCFFVKKSDLSDELATMLRASRSLRSMREEGSWVRLSWSDDWVRKAMIYGRKDGERKIPSPFQERSITIFEGDVDPVRRWFTDTRECSIARQRRGYFDLETDSRCSIKDARAGKARILSIALSNEDESDTWVDVLKRFDDDAERELIAEFFRRVDVGGYGQLLAWAGDSFDFGVLKERIERLGMRIDLRRYLLLDHLVLFRRMNLNSSDSGDEKQSMALQAIAQAQLGEGKEEAPPEVARRWPGRSMASISYELWKHFPDVLARYNLKDTILMPRIEKKTGFAALFDTICDVCRVLPDSRGLLPTKQMDGFMLRLGLDRDHRFATRYFSEEERQNDQFLGAYVMEPKRTGIVRGVHVADFAGLYPSVIRTWNMSPETKRGIPVNGPIPAGHCRSPKTGIGFATDVEGMLPFACRTMMGLRKEWSKKQAALPPGTPEWKEAGRRSMAYKVAVNSFYGVVGSPYSRYFDREVAESVTQNAVWLILSTIYQAETRGMQVFYGDTDSFFALASRTEFEIFVKWCNAEHYPAILASVGCVPEQGCIELAYEKEFATIVMIGKKRYAGRFEHYKGSKAKPVPAEGEAFDKSKHSRPEIKGLEFKRGDASVLARRLQERVIMALMRDDERPSTYRDMVGEVLRHVAFDDLPLEEIQLSKSLAKPPSQYHRKTPTGKEQAVPPHVKVAEQLLASGRDVGEGQRVSYVVVDATDGIEAIPAEDYVGELDRYYVWENMVYPPTMRVLEKAFPDENWIDGLESVRPRKRRALKGQRALFACARDPITEGNEIREEARRHHDRAVEAIRIGDLEASAWRA